MRRIISARVSTRHEREAYAEVFPSRPDSAPSQGRADTARLRRVSEAGIARSAPIELRDLPAHFWDGAVPVLPGAKAPISLRLDADVLAWFRESGPRYQSRMNAVLRSYMEGVLKPAGKRPGRRGSA